jgi:hypothetical protein
MEHDPDMTGTGGFPFGQVQAPRHPEMSQQKSVLPVFAKGEQEILPTPLDTGKT